MNHLTPAELVQWRDEGRIDGSDAVLEHLAGCDACRGALVDLIKAEAPTATPTLFDARDFTRRGYAAYGGRGRFRWLVERRPMLVAGSAVAALVLLTALTSVLHREALRPGGVPGDVRGGELRPLAPAGPVKTPFEFRWTSPVAASRYRLTVYGTNGQPVYTRIVDAERTSLPEELRARLVPGQTYSWAVDALDDAGAIIVASPREAFTVVRK
jgi:hypothetical protein